MLLGNDIVDLQEARRTSNWRRPRYLEKIFTPQEQAWIRQADQADCWVWMLWSAKESAYKLSRRLGAERIYAPKRLAIQDWMQTGTNEYVLRVQTERAEVTVHAALSSAFVHSVAVLDTARRYEHEVIPVANNHAEQSSQLRIRVLQDLQARFGSACWIKKDDRGIPQAWIGESQLDVVLSLSHHGRYGAYCWARS